MGFGKAVVLCGLALGSLVLCMASSCPNGQIPGVPYGGTAPVYNNTTDRTNGGASYLGSAPCRACHPDIAQEHDIHGHARKLNRVLGEPPTYPPQGTRAGVPNPPQGSAWKDISYVIGGYIRKARFVDQDGYILTTGFNKVDPQWNLLFPANGTTPSFVPYEASNTARKPYDYSCFLCHTVGPAPQNPANPQFQDNRPGLIGTWQEAGVQCEACHGPGSRHVPNPQARDNFVDTSAAACGQCHSRPHPSVGNAAGGVIQAKPEGFIDHHEQWPELLASGGHASFDCITCHDPHASTNYDRTRGIRKECTDCHADKTLGFHVGKQYVKGDYVESLSCASCHMPYATKSAASTLVGESKGRVGDMRTHIFRINVSPADYTTMFTADKTQVVKDASGRAAVTIDFICLRCHNTENGFPFRLTLRSASEIAAGMHKFSL